MLSVLRGIERSDHPPPTKRKLLGVMLPRVRVQYASGAAPAAVADAPRIAALAARWATAPPLPCFAEAGRALLAMIVSAVPSAFTGAWFDGLRQQQQQQQQAQQSQHYLHTLDSTLSVVLPILHRVGTRAGSAGGAGSADKNVDDAHFSLCTRVLHAIQPIVPVHRKLSARLRARIAVTLAHIVPCLASKDTPMHASLTDTLLVAPVIWLNSRSVVEEGSILVHSHPQGREPGGRNFFIASVVNLCKLAWATGKPDGSHFYKRVMTTSQRALDTLCGKFDTLLSADEIWDSNDSFTTTSSKAVNDDFGQDPLAIVVGTLPVQLMPTCCSGLAQSAYLYHNTELERMLKRMSRWDFHPKPHPSASAGLWLEGIVHALCSSARFDVLVLAGRDAVFHLARQLSHRDPQTGRRRSTFWGALERLVIGHPNPNVLEAIVPVLRSLLQGWLASPPVTPAASVSAENEPGADEHDFCARVLALVQVLIALNNNASSVSSSTDVVVMSDLEKLWHRVSLAATCAPQTSVQLLQICRRGAWTTAEGTMAVALETFNQSFSDSSTPNSQILTWSTRIMRPVLPLRPGPGLENLGNTCYLNSVVQSLFHTDAFRELLLRGGGSLESQSSGGSMRNENPELLLALKRLFTFMTLSMRNALEGDSIITPFRRALRDEAYRGYQQQDAAEFTKYLLNELADTCGLRKAVDLFGGHLTTSVCCGRCGKTSVSTPERFMELSLSLDSGAKSSQNQRISIGELMKRFRLPEVLEGSNRYRCASETCQGQLVDHAERVTAVSSYPSHLVLSLKRFYYSKESGSVAKIMDEVDFPRMLTVIDPDDSTRQIEFSLYGAIMHIGRNASSGHYVAYTTHSSEARFASGGDGTGNGDDVWWRCDDSEVVPLASSDWLKRNGIWGRKRRRQNNSTVYMLLYKRHNDEDVGVTDMDVDVDTDGEGTTGGGGGNEQYFHANAMSVPPEMSEACKLDNVKYMLSVHQKKISEHTSR